MAFRARESLPLAALAALGLLAVLVVDPRGNFPLNDDWSYAHAVRHLLDRGELRLSDWGSPALLIQVLWGAAFAWPVGFSFEALRASTLVLGLVALISTYGVMRELEAGRALAWLAALMLLGNPIFLVLALTFMTDVPFLGLGMAALFLLLRGFERDSRTALAGGLMLAVAATFVRQIGLALLVGFAAATLARDWRGVRRWVLALAPLLAGFGLLQLYEAWLSRDGGLPAAYDFHWHALLTGFGSDVPRLVRRSLGTVLRMAIHLGLYLAPIAALWLLAPARGERRRRVLVAAAATAATFALAAWSPPAPYFTNLLLQVGCADVRVAVGPPTLYDGCTGVEPGLGSLGLAPRWILTWLGLVGAGSLAAAGFAAWSELRRRPRDPRRRGTIALLVASAASYFGLVALLDVVFDRYLLFLIPLALALFVASIRGRPTSTRSFALAGTLAAAMLLFSVGATQEYLDWNRARWRAIAFLAAEREAGREQIDGGFEFAGWVNFDLRARHDHRGASWWWVVEDRYLVAFAEVPGYDVVARFPYRGWLGLVEDDVLALERRSGG